MWPVFPLLPLLLASIGTSGCYEGVCTPADTTHGCCVKNHLIDPETCDAIDGAEGVAFRGTSTHQGTASGGKTVAIAAGTIAAAGTAAVLVTMNDAVEVKRLQIELDEMMEECAELAEQAVDSRRPKDELLDSVRCNETVGIDADGKPVTRAMQLGNEKHREASRCVDEKLRKRMDGHFSIEQRYRYDIATGKLELVSLEEEQHLIQQGRKHELSGTLKPDVVIHSGNPTQARFIYDFKFPCVKDSPPRWNIYTRGPYRDTTQGQIYEKAFGVRPGRVVPGRKGVIR